MSKRKRVLIYFGFAPSEKGKPENRRWLIFSVLFLAFVVGAG
jgi:uncharacterized membrane protein YoaK (UPF0700 family)